MNRTRGDHASSDTETDPRVTAGLLMGLSILISAILATIGLLVVTVEHADLALLGYAGGVCALILVAAVICSALIIHPGSRFWW